MISAPHATNRRIHVISINTCTIIISFMLMLFYIIICYLYLYLGKILFYFYLCSLVKLVYRYGALSLPHIAPFSVVTLFIIPYKMSVVKQLESCGWLQSVRSRTICFVHYNLFLIRLVIYLQLCRFNLNLPVQYYACMYVSSWYGSSWSDINK